MKEREVSLHVEALRLHGFPPAHRARIGAAFERELSALLGAELPAALGAARHVRALPRVEFRAPGHAGPEAVGAAVARAVYGRLSK